jgi:rod shape-determining protein MreC
VLPLQQVVNAPTSMVRWLSDTLMSREELQEENRRLRQRNFLTTAQLQKLTVLEAENRRLRTLLESAANIPQRAIIAELINVDDDPYRHRILVGKGTTHGVRRGQPVLDANGVVGQIMHAGPLASTAVLITDPSHALPVQVDRNGLRGLLLGTGRFDRLELPHVPNNADVQVGDLLITSGLGGRFPRGYPVARVVSVEPDPGQPFARIVARPTTELDRIREVLLLINEPLLSGGEDEEAAGTPEPDE